MRLRRILFRPITLAAILAAGLLWLNQRKEKNAPPTSLPNSAPASQTAGVPRPRPVYAVSDTVLSASPSPGAAPSVSDSGAEKTVHLKLQQWLSTTTGDTETQEALTHELLALLTDENTAEIIQALSPQEFDTPFAARALERWLKIDAAAAARWLAARPDVTEEHALLVARRWLEDPAGLRDYSDHLPEGSWKQNVLASASLELASKNPVAALDLAQRLAPGDARTNALETIAYDWFGRDLPAAVDWIKTVDDPLLRERLFAVGAKAIATADPDLAAGWLVSSVKTEGVLNETALSLVETWADQHPTAAANWVARFSEAGPRKIAIDLLLSHWLKSDPVAANAWIQTLPEREAIAAKLKAEQAERDRPPE